MSTTIIPQERAGAKALEDAIANSREAFDAWRAEMLELYREHGRPIFRVEDPRARSLAGTSEALSDTEAIADYLQEGIEMGSARYRAVLGEEYFNLVFDEKPEFPIELPSWAKNLDERMSDTARLKGWEHDVTWSAHIESGLHEHDAYLHQMLVVNLATGDVRVEPIEFNITIGGVRVAARLDVELSSTITALQKLAALAN